MSTSDLDSSYDSIKYPKTTLQFDRCLECSTPACPAYLPMLVTRSFDASKSAKLLLAHSTIFKGADETPFDPVSLTHGNIVSALYKRGEIVVVRTPQNKTGAAPYDCVSPIGVRISTTDFMQQYPEGSTIANPIECSTMESPIYAHIDQSNESTRAESAGYFTDMNSTCDSYQLNDLECLTMRRQSRLILTRMAIMRARDEYSSPELSFCVNYNQGGQRRNIALLNSNAQQENDPNANQQKTLRRSNSRCVTTQTHTKANFLPKSIPKPILKASLLKNAKKDEESAGDRHIQSNVTSSVALQILSEKQHGSRKPLDNLSFNVSKNNVSSSDNDMTVGTSPWWNETPSVVEENSSGCSSVSSSSRVENLLPVARTVIKENNSHEGECCHKKLMSQPFCRNLLEAQKVSFNCSKFCHQATKQPQIIRPQPTRPMMNRLPHRETSMCGCSIKITSDCRTNDAIQCQTTQLNDLSCSGLSGINPLNKSHNHIGVKANSTKNIANDTYTSEPIYENLPYLYKPRFERTQPLKKTTDPDDPNISKLSAITTSPHVVFNDTLIVNHSHENINNSANVTRNPVVKPCAISPDHSYFSLSTGDSDSSSSTTSSRSSGVRFIASPPQTPPEMILTKEHQNHMTVLFDYEATDNSDISIRQNEIITILEDSAPEWVYARRTDGKAGYVPKAYVVNLHSLHLSFDPRGNKTTYL